MSSSEIGLVLMMALILGLMWEWRRDRATARRVALEKALESGDPETVDGALAAIRRSGVADHAGLLLRLIDHDPPAEVRRSVVDLVAVHQWEPVSSDAVRRLRDWAAEESIRSPAPRPELSTPSSDIETGLARRVEVALGEPVTWLFAETPEGNFVVERPDEDDD